MSSLALAPESLNCPTLDDANGDAAITAFPLADDEREFLDSIYADEVELSAAELDKLWAEEQARIAADAADEAQATMDDLRAQAARQDAVGAALRAAWPTLADAVRTAPADVTRTDLEQRIYLAFLEAQQAVLQAV